MGVLVEPFEAVVGTSPLPDEPDEAAVEWMQRACRRVWAGDADWR